MIYTFNIFRFDPKKDSEPYRQEFRVDLGDADRTFCYLFPDIMPRLGEKLSRELKPGALVISANFPFPGWKPEEVLTCENTIFNDPIYLYRIGSSKGSAAAKPYTTSRPSGSAGTARRSRSR